MQGLMGDLQTGNFDRQAVLKKYEQMMTNINQFSAMKMDIDDRGNISTQATKVSELTNKNEKNPYREAILKVYDDMRNEMNQTNQQNTPNYSDEER